MFRHAMDNLAHEDISLSTLNATQSTPLDSTSKDTSSNDDLLQYDVPSEQDRLSHDPKKGFMNSNTFMKSDPITAKRRPYDEILLDSGMNFSHLYNSPTGINIIPSIGAGGIAPDSDQACSNNEPCLCTEHSHKEQGNVSSSLPVRSDLEETIYAELTGEECLVATPKKKAESWEIQYTELNFFTDKKAIREQDQSSDEVNAHNESNSQHNKSSPDLESKPSHLRESNSYEQQDTETGNSDAIINKADAPEHNKKAQSDTEGTEKDNFKILYSL